MKPIPLSANAHQWSYVLKHSSQNKSLSHLFYLHQLFPPFFSFQLTHKPTFALLTCFLPPNYLQISLLWGFWFVLFVCFYFSSCIYCNQLKIKIVKIEILIYSVKHISFLFSNPPLPVPAKNIKNIPFAQNHSLGVFPLDSSSE